MSFNLPVLPADWSYSPLDSCSQPNSVTYGVVQPGSALAAGKPLIRVNNFRDTRIDLSDVMYIAPEIEAKYSRTRLKGGEVLVTVVGSVGQVAVVPSRFAGFNVARAVAVIHPLPHVAPEWIALCLRSPLSQHLLGSRANTTVQTTINLKDLRALPIPLPPEEERHTIAEFVGALDDRITLLRETNATLEAIAQALFKSWFVDFDPVRAKLEGRAPEGMDEATARLFPDSFEESELGLVPRGWRVATLADTFDINPTRKLSKGVMASYLDMASLATSGHCVEAPIEREMGSGAKFQNGDTLLARITPCLENGKSAFVDFLAEGQIGWGSTEFLVLRPKAPLPQYLGYLLCRHPAFREYAIQSMSGTSGRQRIQNDVLGRYMLAVPSLEIAAVFGSVIEPTQRSIAANHQSAQTLATLRDTLLPRLISGQLRLPEAETLLQGVAA
jgi:type I restriction enzyme S subunit